MVANLRAVPTDRLRDLTSRRAALDLEIQALAEAERRAAESLLDEARRSERIALSIKETALSCGVSVPTVHRWIAGGLPVSRPLGGDRLVMRAALIEWLERWQ